MKLYYDHDNIKIYHGLAEDMADGSLPCKPNDHDVSMSGLFNLCFTSPPYFNAREYGDYKYKDYDDYLHHMNVVIYKLTRLVTEGRFVVWNTSPVIAPREKRSEESVRYGIPYDLHHFFRKHGYSFIDDIFWTKPDPAVPDRNANFRNLRKPLTYKSNSVTEAIMVYRTKSDMLIDEVLALYPNDILKQSLLNQGKLIHRTNLWDGISPASDSEHKGIMPINLAYNVIMLYSLQDDTVFDPFCGTGTTLLAAKRLNRKAVGIEKEERFCEIAAKLLDQGRLF